MDKQVSFQALCHLMEHISRITKKEVKKQKLQLYLDEWRLQDPQLYPLIRLLLPGLDRERSAFGLKESRLADFYIDILGLSKTSHDAFLLKSWEQQSKTTRSDFAEAVFEVLKARLAGTRIEKPLTIAQVNDLLDELNQAPDKKEIFRRLVCSMSAQEQKWAVRVILKNTRIGLGDAMILKCVHPDAQDLYNISSNLRRICTELKNPAVRLNGQQASLELFHPFQPMLANRVATEETLSHMAGEAIIEPKLDGERMQMHWDGSAFRYWSRRGTEYTYLYGRNGDEGSLTKHIAGKCFGESIGSAILDGEMLAYDPKTGDFLPFGTLKAAAAGPGDEATTYDRIHEPRPCFVVFDILYLNGTSLLDKPLNERKQILESSVKPVEGRLMVIEGVRISSYDQLVEQIDLALANKLEGIIVKAPGSKYQVGKRPNDWIKIKPDYVDSLCDDLDLLVVGGSYGRGIGGRPGTISSLSLALKGQDGRFYGLCRVGSGISIGELDRLRARLMPHFIPFDPKNPPKWADLNTSAADRPDLIISHPSLSVILQVKATQIIESTSYPSGYTLRHPRYVRERADRSWDSCMTIQEMRNLFKAEMGSLAKRTVASMCTGPTSLKKQKVARGKWAQAKLSTTLASLDQSKVEKSENILGGMEIYVCTGEGPGGMDKMDLEKRIIELGGKITQAPILGRTEMVMAGKDEGLRLANIKKQGTFDIVRSSWLLDSAKSNLRQPLTQSYLIQATEKTKKMIESLCDPYGDSYVDEIDTDKLKHLLTDAPWPKEEKSLSGIESLREEINKRYLS